MFTKKELEIIRKNTPDKEYLNSANASSKTWDKGAEEASEQSK